MKRPAGLVYGGRRIRSGGETMHSIIITYFLIKMLSGPPDRS